MAEDPAKPTPTPNRGARVLLVAASAVIVVAGLKAAAPILVPLMVAVLLAILSLPLLEGLVRRGTPRGVAVITAIVANLALLGALMLPVAGSVSAFLGQLPKYQRGLVQTATSTIDYLDALGIDTEPLAWLAEWPQPEGLETLAEDELGLDPERRDRDPGRIELGSAVGVLTGTVKRLAIAATNVLLVLLILIFILLEASVLPGKLQEAMGWNADDVERLVGLKRDIQRYLLIKTAISLATGALLAGWLWVLGVDFPLLWGLVAFLLNYIPHIGSILASFPPILLGLISSGLEQALLVAAGYVLVNLTLGSVLEPHLMGRRFGISTLVVFLSLMFWGWVWGPAGMLMSVPLTVILKITLESTEDFRWLGQLLGAPPRQQPTPPAAAASVEAT